MARLLSRFKRCMVAGAAMLALCVAITACAEEADTMLRPPPKSDSTPTLSQQLQALGVEFHWRDGPSTDALFVIRTASVGQVPAHSCYLREGPLAGFAWWSATSDDDFAASPITMTIRLAGSDCVPAYGKANSTITDYVTPPMTVKQIDDTRIVLAGEADGDSAVMYAEVVSGGWASRRELWIRQFIGDVRRIGHDVTETTARQMLMTADWYVDPLE